MSDVNYVVLTKTLLQHASATYCINICGQSQCCSSKAELLIKRIFIAIIVIVSK